MNFRNPVEAVPAELFRGLCAIQAMGVEGDVAEFGTMTGTTAQVLAGGLAFVDVTGFALTGMVAEKRNLHLFDSFEGLPMPGEGDAGSPMVEAGGWGAGTHKGLSAQQLLARCAPLLGSDRLRIFEGWFCNTIPTIPDGTRYALIHIDSDLYSSAVDVLDGLFGRSMVADGALIYFDDWNCNFASPRFGERRAWRECVDKYAVEWDDLGDYGMVSHKVLVRSYRVP